MVATLFIAENNKNKSFKLLSPEEIVMVTTNKGRVPTIYTGNEEYSLVTKLSQIKDIVIEFNFNFALSDRGTLINLDKIMEYDHSRNILTFDCRNDIYATVSGGRKIFFKNLIKSKS